MEHNDEYYGNMPDVVKIKIEKYEKLAASGKDPYRQTKFLRTAYAKDIKEHFADYDGKAVCLAGRIMAKRGQGKVAFYDLLDVTDKIQMFCKKDILGDSYEEVLSYDIGDIVGVEGEVFATQRGEISIRVSRMTLLTKSIQVLPEKFHGLKDTDLRYRQRYTDLIMDPEVKDVFIKRTRIISAIREFMDNRGFIEVETPVLSTLAGGASARPFVTHHNTLDIAMYLRIATELNLKRLIVGGFDKVYEIGRVFRNEGMDATHNPEFTSMESYESYTDYNGVMDMVEELFSFLGEKINGSTDVSYQGLNISLKAPYRRARMVDLVTEATGIDFDKMTDVEEARKAARSLGIDVEDSWGIGKMIEAAFDAKVEETIVQPTFVTDHPTEISPLAKKCAYDPRYTERFEIFIAGHEYGNAFSELNDPFDQRDRFLAQMEAKAKGDDEAHPYDADFINALEVGLPPTGGLGIGIDRLVMLLTDQPTIRDVILFPTMKPIDTPKNKNGAQKTEDAAEEGAVLAVDTADPKMPLFDARIPDFEHLSIEPLFEDQVDFETFSKSDFRAVKVKDCVAVPKSKKLLQFTLDDGSGTDRTILSGIHSYYEPEDLIGKTCIAITNLPPKKMMGIDSCGMLISAVHNEGEEEKLHLLMVDPNIPAGAKLY
ncbi:MAG: lysine--tRNA ligase [Eubacteriales bacterium]|nr:lysine--tRNA ligase [Eubacteriales bacterium]